MELRRYLAILKRWWRLALPAFVLTTGLTLFWVLPQPPVYEARATFVVAPRSLDPDEAVNAFDTLIRGAQITATYATIAESDLIRKRAEEKMPPSISTSGSVVGAEVQTGTNVLQISVQASDAETATRFASAVAAETVQYVDELSQAYALDPLDAPQLPKLPVGPQKGLTIGLGVFIGLVLATSIALFAEYLNPSEGVEEHAEPEGVDDRLLHDERSFRSRFRREITRTKRTGHAFSFGMVRLKARSSANGQPTGISLAHGPEPIAEALQATLRKEDALAWLGDGVFAVLLPDTPVAEAGLLVSGWKKTIVGLPNGHGEGTNVGIDVSTGVCEYRESGFVGDPDTTRVAGALSGAGPSRTDEGNGRAPVTRVMPTARGDKKQKGQSATWKKRSRGVGRRG